MSGGLSEEELSRIVVAIETIEASLGVLAEKRRLSRETYKEDSDTQDIVERRFVKMTEATLDIGAVLVRHDGVRRRRATQPRCERSARLVF